MTFLNNTALIDALKEELLTQHLTLAADASREFKLLDLWKHHETDLPKWATAACQIVLEQLSSAEFSILHNCYGGKQQHSLGDYIEASLCMSSLV